MTKNEVEKKDIMSEIKKEFPRKKEQLTIISRNNCDVVEISLPKDFFEQIITNEVELSEEFKYEKLFALVQLYLNAIQYYSSMEPEKANAYKNRLENLLTEKETLKNLCKRKNEKIKSTKASKVIRDRAKNILKILKTNSRAIKKEEIKKRVKQVMIDNSNQKEHKKNVKILINSEFESQNKKWKEKLAQKREQGLIGLSRFTIGSKHRKSFNTPGPCGRQSLDIGKNNSEEKPFELSGRNLPKYGNIDDDDSEDENKIENKEVSDFVNMLKEEHKKNSDDEGSIIDDNYDDGNDNDNANENKGSNSIVKIIEAEEEDNKDLNNEQESNNTQKKEDNEIKTPIKGILKKKNKETEGNTQEKIEEKKVDINQDKEIMNEFKQNYEKGRLAIQRTKSIVDENVIREMEPDEEIKKIVEEKMKILENLENGNDSENDSNFASSASVPSIVKRVCIDDIPPIFQETFEEVEIKIKEYIKALSDHFYKETIEDFSLKLKDLYDSKYNKYIMVNNDYHSSITEKEYLLENEENLNEEKKLEIQSIIDSLKEEQKDQIDKIVDEYNNNIILLINEFKQNSFRKNTAIQLLEEQLRLDIYTLINEAFY